VSGEAGGGALVGGRGVVLGYGSLLPENGIRIRASELGGVTRVELYSRVAEVGYDFFRECGE